MSAANSISAADRQRDESRPLVSIVVPVFNEEALIERTVRRIFEYTNALSGNYDAELIVVNDGSADRTAQILDQLTAGFPTLHVANHSRNRGLGAALRTGFDRAAGEYVVTLDADLSYDVDHIGKMLDVLMKSQSDVVLASPFMSGGSIRNVPGIRLFFSRAANYFLAKVSQGNLTTYTCMVRAYRRDFLQQLPLRAAGMDIMPETVYKAQIMKGAIAETPAALDWEVQNRHRHSGGRQSSMRLIPHILGTALSGFMLRPMLFLLVPGFLLSLLAFYCGVWMLIHTVDAWSVLASQGPGRVTISAAVALAFAESPHTFVIGFLTTILAIQLVAVSLLALQSKRYFEDLLSLNSQIRARQSDTITNPEK